MVPIAPRLTPCLTPHHRLLLVPADDALAVDPTLGERIGAAFARGTGHGLLWLGAREVTQSLPPVFAYWREFGGRFVTALCSTPNLDEHDVKFPQPPDNLEEFAAAVPTMPGAEYLSTDVLQLLWAELGRAFAAELQLANLTIPDFLKSLNPNWNVVGRVHFNLAEYRKDETAPFAFLATYSHRLSAHGKAQHLPLGQALRDYAGETNKDKLLSLLLPVQRAAESCTWLKAMVASGEVFHPLRFTPQEAFRFLGDVPALERAGVIVRMPVGFRAGRPPRPQVSARIGASIDPDWSHDVAGPWLAETLKGLRQPEELAAIDPGRELLASLSCSSRTASPTCSALTSVTYQKRQGRPPLPGNQRRGVPEQWPRRRHPRPRPRPSPSPSPSPGLLRPVPNRGPR